MLWFKFHFISTNFVTKDPVGCSLLHKVDVMFQFTNISVTDVSAIFLMLCLFLLFSFFDKSLLKIAVTNQVGISS